MDFNANFQIGCILYKKWYKERILHMAVIDIPAGLDTKGFALGKGEINALPDLLDKFFPGKTPWVIADDNTFEAAGRLVMEVLSSAGKTVREPYIFPAVPRLHPEYSYSQELAKCITADIVPVAAGSGVINDIVKCAAGIAGVHYCCVPTACSVDGYTSFGGAMSVDGCKKTVKCPPPLLICADVDILETAPAEMLASGYADLLTKVPAGVDWIIADFMKEEKIVPEVWQVVQNDIHRWVADKNNMLNIFEGLAATGYAMQMYQDSRPASGAEHLFSHVWEMEGLSRNGEEISHGFKVGVGLLISSRLMEFVLEHSAEEIVSMAVAGVSVEEREAEIAELLKKGCYGSGIRETALGKFICGKALADRRQFMYSAWSKLQERMKERFVPVCRLKEMLSAAGAPVFPADIGLDREQLVHGIKTAQLIRNRYTVLDLLYEAGVLDAAIETVVF